MGGVGAGGAGTNISRCLFFSVSIRWRNEWSGIKIYELTASKTQCVHTFTWMGDWTKAYCLRSNSVCCIIWPWNLDPLFVVTCTKEQWNRGGGEICQMDSKGVWATRPPRCVYVYMSYICHIMPGGSVHRRFTFYSWYFIVKSGRGRDYENKQCLPPSACSPKFWDSALHHGPGHNRCDHQSVNSGWECDFYLLLTVCFGECFLLGL